jgi:hypothetical protein
MEKYFPDVKDSIPHIIEGCFLVWDSTDIDEIYKLAKERKRFGETEDC